MDWAFHFFQKQEWGHLIVISSVGGMRGEGIAPAYNASKAYQINYTEGLEKKQPSYLILLHWLKESVSLEDNQVQDLAPLFPNRI